MTQPLEWHEKKEESTFNQFVSHMKMLAPLMYANRWTAMLHKRKRNMGRRKISSIPLAQCTELEDKHTAMDGCKNTKKDQGCIKLLRMI